MKKIAYFTISLIISFILYTVCYYYCNLATAITIIFIQTSLAFIGEAALSLSKWKFKKIEFDHVIFVLFGIYWQAVIIGAIWDYVEVQYE